MYRKVLNRDNLINYMDLSNVEYLLMLMFSPDSGKIQNKLLWIQSSIFKQKHCRAKIAKYSKLTLNKAPNKIVKVKIMTKDRYFKRNVNETE